MNISTKKKLLKYGQYKYDIFNKMNLELREGSKILDVGCGDGQDGEIFINVFRLKTYATDIFKHGNISKIKDLKFKLGSIYKLPYDDNQFDYVFLHNVLHHIDEKNQSFSKHKKALKEIERVCKNKGRIYILEANRYNPLFYPHLVLMGKHNHFTQQYFVKLMKSVFMNVESRHFEAHLYPSSLVGLFKLYEFAMERFMPKKFQSYNFSSIEVNK